MSQQQKQRNGCGCANIPISVIILILGGGCWWFAQAENRVLITNLIGNVLPENQQVAIPVLNSTPNASSPTISKPVSTPTPIPLNTPNQQQTLPPAQISTLPTPWDKKAIRGIYVSRYNITNNADEQTIRKRVRYYSSQGINTIIHGVWGNGCTMYNSEVMQQTLGYKSCPNQFQDRWLDWLIDEAHQQGMQVHAYFEKGIKIDKNSPIFDLAIARKWVVPGVDRTYAGIEHYVLDVEIPEVANFFKNISVEFVKKYPQIDAVQWDDYLGYHAELPGQVDRTAKLTSFVKQMIAGIKQANPKVSFDICHHNPYWAKRYFAADWSKWGVDRAFIQVYNDANFQEELNYVKDTDGIAISEQQLNRLNELVNNQAVKSILIFPTSGKPEAAAAKVKNLLTAKTPESKSSSQPK